MNKLPARRTANIVAANFSLAIISEFIASSEGTFQPHMLRSTFPSNALRTCLLRRIENKEFLITCKSALSFAHFLTLSAN